VDFDKVAVFLDELSRLDSDLGRDRASVTAFAPSGPVSAFDFEKCARELSSWVRAEMEAHPLRADTRALYVGLYESPGGCSLFVSGFSRYDASDSGWASQTPLFELGVCPAVSARLGELMQSLDDEPTPAWVVVLGVTMAILKAVRVSLLVGEPTGSGSPIAVTTGFVDGDLYVIGGGAVAA
jgi:hypothetical protein